ncbi:DegV family protein [Alkalihalobacterium chitinilyticum]|uniref:DegV family protein n=1 Tax=Alkalihalobacterium chitinilyticum TaxID=2980103 RepID=A0ABT5VKT3_9BACI|nr:DegV family protein [Alkalihalobacterium chitinilyticum]MDE5415362.1 DegV family protein [Alkalihalobacterium chitinilyticum]
MKKIKIVTDSTVDFYEQLKDLDVEVVPLSVTIEGKSYLDGVDITSQEYIEKLTQVEEIPKTSQPAVGTFVDTYNRLGEDGSEIISIHMTSGMSGTVTAAETAAGLVDVPVTVVDSKFISAALSFQVIEAAEMAKEGKSKEEILQRLEEVRSNTSLYIMVDTLDYLVKGGRIGRGKALIGSLLKIKPIASLADGVYTPVTKVRTYSQLIKYVQGQFKEEMNGKTVKSIGIAHADTESLANQIKESFSNGGVSEDKINIAFTTPIISTHTGPGAIAVMYYAE